MILRATARLVKALGPVGVLTAEPRDDDWYGNLVFIERRKCVVLAHVGTLFAVFVADVRVEELRPIGPFAATHVETALRVERLPLDTFGPLDPDGVQVARTASRSIVASLNDIVAQARHHIAYEGGLRRADLSAINHSLCTVPNGSRGFRTPLELVAERLAGRS